MTSTHITPSMKGWRRWVRPLFSPCCCVVASSSIFSWGRNSSNSRLHSSRRNRNKIICRANDEEADYYSNSFHPHRSNAIICRARQLFIISGNVTTSGKGNEKKTCTIFLNFWDEDNLCLHYLDYCSHLLCCLHVSTDVTFDLLQAYLVVFGSLSVELGNRIEFRMGPFILSLSTRIYDATDKVLGFSSKWHSSGGVESSIVNADGMKN